MRKLLRANFARLWKDKVFWGALVVLACYGVLGCISQYRLVEEGYDVTDQYSRIFLNVYLFNSVALRRLPTCFWAVNTATARSGTSW